MTRLIDDMISRKALLEAFKSRCFDTDADWPTMEHLITNAPTVQREGWVSVPIEPTKEMKRAYTDKFGYPSYGAGHEYRFMVKIAPKE
jgi:hypothetical protein